MKKDHVVRFEDAKCVWRLNCPYCGWLFGFCLDLTGWHLTEDVIFLVSRRRRVPTRFPRKESGRTFAYFKVRRRVCARCRALLIREDDVSDWLSSIGVGRIDCNDLEEFLQGTDSCGRAARICSDRVYDTQFEEWGVDGMPARYLSVRDENLLRKKLQGATTKRWGRTLGLYRRP